MLDWTDLLSPAGPHFHFTDAPLPPVPLSADGLQRLTVALPDESTLARGGAEALLLGALEQAFDLPGRMPDLAALTEVLRERAPLALVLEVAGLRGLFRAAPEVAGAWLHAWATVAEERRTEGVSMHLVGHW